MVGRTHKSMLGNSYDLKRNSVRCDVLTTAEQQTSTKAANDERFRWYERSRLDGSLRPMKEIRNDKCTYLELRVQRELDEEAVNLARNRTYPGGMRVLLDPSLVSEVTGSNGLK